VTLALAAEMLVHTGIAAANRDGLTRAKAALDDGRAAQVFGRMVSVLGGPADFVERADKYLKRAAVEHPVKAPHDGFVASVATRDVGVAVVALGGGRTKPEDPVDHSVGITGLLPVGSAVSEGEPLAIVHARSRSDAEQAEAAILAAYTIGAKKPPAAKAVIRRVAAG
jgi:thymidine phosphorylase